MDRRRLPAVYGWSSLLILIAVLGIGGYFGRDAIVERIPQAARLYELVGLAPTAPGEGLTLEFSLRRQEVEGQQRLIIEGVIANVSERPRPVPSLRASLIDSQGQEIMHWDFSAPTDALSPGDTTTFETSTPAPGDKVVVNVCCIPGK